MEIHFIGIGVLLAAFVLTTIRPINLGVICLAAAFIVGHLIGGLSPGDIYGGFPANLFTLLVGVTLLFTLARNNGTLDWLTVMLVKLARGSDYTVPWIFFGICTVFSAIGSAYSVTMLAPIALAYAARHNISQFVMGVVLVHGQLAGGLFPISLYGLIIQGVLDENGMDSNPFLLFAIAFVLNLAIAAALIVSSIVTGRFRPKALVTTGSGSTGDVIEAEQPVTETPKFTSEMAVSLASIVLLIAGALALGFDLGLWAMLLVLLVAAFRPSRLDPALKEVPWSVVVLVTGVLTYIGALETLGTIDFIGNAVSAFGAPLVAVLVLGYIAAIISAFATSSGVITALVPLAMPLLLTGDVNVFATIALVAVTSTIVDVSPFSTHGASIVAYSTEERRTSIFRALLAYGGFMTLVMPAVIWAILILPTSL